MRTCTAVLAALIAVSVPSMAVACTAFSAATPAGPLLAKGFDWMTGEGWIVVNERGRSRSLLFPGAPPDDGAWTSKHASVSLTTVGPGLPVSGMNEAGLAVEALVDLSASPTATPAAGRLTGLELVQYALDRFETVAELAEFAEKKAVTQLGVALHFFACDASGACVVIEPGPKATRVTRGLKPKALANNPWAKDVEAMTPSPLAWWLGWGSPRPGSSAFRFRTVARAAVNAPPRDSTAALAVLEKVAMPGRTQWQIVWDLTERSMTLRQREAKLGTMSLKLEGLDRNCVGAPRVLPLGRAAQASFAPWSEEDEVRSERALRRQLGNGGPQVSRLASLIAAAIRSSACPPAQ